MMRCFPFVLAALFSAIGSARAEHRVALLIGNDAYPDAELASPAEDVRTVAAALERRGFRTTKLRNLERQAFEPAIRAFAAGVPTRATALVYFAGYALQGEDKDRRDNYLLPTDAKLRNARDVGNQGFGVRRLLEVLAEESGSGANIVIIDGADGPPQRPEDVPTGLHEPEGVAADSLVMLVAGRGAAIEAGEGGPSRVAAAIATAFTSDHDSATETLFAAVAKSVEHATNGSRTPWIGGELPARHDLDPARASAAIAPPDEFTTGRAAGDEWVNGAGMVFCWCPPGRFTMGSPVGTPGRGDDEEPTEVTLTEGFWIGKFELTRGQAEAISRLNPRHSIGDHKHQPLAAGTHKDIGRLLRPLNESEAKAGRLPSDWEYALPTEFEWEYAARAGTSSPYYFGDDPAELPLHVNFADRSLLGVADVFYGYADRKLDDGTPYLARVGSYAPNPWGLHDVYGNVWEWTLTPYRRELPSGVDPYGIEKQNAGGPVARGGSWCSPPDYCRSAFRHHFGDREERNFLGFRLVIRKQRS